MTEPFGQIYLIEGSGLRSIEVFGWFPSDAATARAGLSEGLTLGVDNGYE